MILTLLILLILVGGFFIGLRSGLVLQVVGLTGFIVALAVSYLYFDRLSPYLRWIPFPGSSGGNSELFYYQALAFVPNAFAQQTVSDSTLAQTIVEDTPVLSEKVEEL
ncbi:hypothetical protein TH5N_11410 [Tetragenococcus halophilus]|uniref:CvpA family protein n=1 Tax=Tetragenococcus halophilus TaxID=51669 RepID=UPI001926A0CF|nr:CvpA family protein [Tetragenococcus halophilus]GEQ38021.1 hypothetical protein TH3N_11470 [Tetragenococcus halophilus]GEQ40263.1 hypothetical protein TH5N_11410 [Tetragenococcus halophilus]GEQ42515.1 hypothetical protein TH6N_11410 [Tetragenococcus halophilus]GEQ44773.1 hypothetical protein TH8N_11430 [Tetragenococcus halophilus]GEQ47039.1 hypothetical protein TH9N_11520 [Tetragenococcus halophilus]